MCRNQFYNRVFCCPDSYLRREHISKQAVAWPIVERWEIAARTLVAEMFLVEIWKRLQLFFRVAANGPMTTAKLLELFVCHDHSGFQDLGHRTSVDALIMSMRQL